MILKTEQRVAIFIDTQNMYHSAKHLYGARVNFTALVEAVVGGRHVIRAIAYVAKSKTGEEQAFFDALTQNGIELKIKDVQEFASGAKKADWDVGMAVDALSIAPHVDVVILVTGDGDFCPVVEYLHTHGVACEVAAFGESTNSHLREIAHTFIDLSSDTETFLIQGRGRAHHDSHGHEAKEAGTSDLEEVQPARAGRNQRRGPQDRGPAQGLRKIRITY